MLRLLDRIAAGKGSEGDIATIRRLAHAMQKASLCGLGQGAPNPVLSALRYFEPEFRGRLTSGSNRAGANRDRDDPGHHQQPSVEVAPGQRSSTPPARSPSTSDSVQAPDLEATARAASASSASRLEQDAARLLHAGRAGHGDHHRGSGDTTSAGRWSR